MGWIALRTPPFVYLQFFWYTCIWLISIAMHCLSIDKLCVLKGVLKQAAQEEVYSHWLHLLTFLQCDPSMVVMIIKLRHAGQAVVGCLHISGCCNTMNAQIRSRNEAKVETWESSARGCLS